MKKILIIMLMALVAQADMYTDKTYECIFYKTVKMNVMVVDGGEIGMIGDIILFRVKGILYGGVNHQGKRMYMIIHHEDNIVEVGGEGLASSEGTCIEAKEL